MYPMGKTVRERLEVGLGSRIIDMRHKLAKVSRDKSAKQLARATAQEGVVLDCDASDGEPNIYADNVVNLVRKARHRERKKTVQEKNAQETRHERRRSRDRDSSVYSSDMRMIESEGGDGASRKRLGGTLETEDESDEGY